jgi:hypothetical protein
MNRDDIRQIVEEVARLTMSTSDADELMARFDDIDFADAVARFEKKDMHRRFMQSLAATDDLLRTGPNLVAEGSDEERSNTFDRLVTNVTALWLSAVAVLRRGSSCRRICPVADDD